MEGTERNHIHMEEPKCLESFAFEPLIRYRYVPVPSTS
jgi:hypothetical protein